MKALSQMGQPDWILVHRRVPRIVRRHDDQTQVRRLDTRTRLELRRLLVSLHVRRREQWRGLCDCGATKPASQEISKTILSVDRNPLVGRSTSDLDLVEPRPTLPGHEQSP